jgi:outer membrane lipoprotein SlyB
LTSAGTNANKPAGSQKEDSEMIRKFGIAALLGLAIAMPAHEAAAQNTLGGALLGGAAGAVVGGAVGGGRGAAIGAVIGAGTGAAIASEGERRRGGYYWYHDGCYVERYDGWMRVHPRYCY